MAVYLIEREVGYDDEIVGFPNLGGCTGVVMQTAQGLYGWHSMPGDVPGAGLSQFIAANPHGNITRLYGAANLSRRFGGDTAQVRVTKLQAELQQFAAAINYAGTIYACDLTKLVKDLAAGDSIYVEYRRDTTNSANACGIYYKRCSKMGFTDGTVGPGVVVQRLTACGVLTNSTMKGGGNIVASADIKVTFWNKGELHQVPDAKILAF
jgi:hypothetical protein